MNITTTILNATASIITPTDKVPKSLNPSPGAPLSSDPSLVPSKYLSEKESVTSTATAVNLHPRRETALPLLNLVRSPPSQLLDAPARAALNMPNAMTAPGQARAVRGGEAKTPEYEIDEDADPLHYTSRQEESVPLLAPTAIRPGLSRSSSTASTSSNRGILRRIFIDRATTPTQHLTRPTFPPPSLSTYSPQSPSPLSFLSKINLFINQTISIILSTFFLAFVVSWALSVETYRAVPKWLRWSKPRTFPWDDERYWRKEGRKVSKDPRDYALQVGMDIEHQTVETDDGYFLK